MAVDYTMHWSFDSLKQPFTLHEGETNTKKTSLTLTGYGVVNWSEHLLNNELYLLEHFASKTAPLYPTAGQLWYDLNVYRLKVFDGADWLSLNDCSGIPDDVIINRPVVTRVGTIPFVNGITSVTLTPVFQSSAFSVSNGGVDHHRHTDWEIRLGPDVYSELIFSSYEDTVNKVSVTVPFSLNNSTTYFIRVRYQGDQYGNSRWSEWGRFTTIAAVLAPSIDNPYITGFENVINALVPTIVYTNVLPGYDNEVSAYMAATVTISNLKDVGTTVIPDSTWKGWGSIDISINNGGTLQNLWSNNGSLTMISPSDGLLSGETGSFTHSSDVYNVTVRNNNTSVESAQLPITVKSSAWVEGQGFVFDEALHGDQGRHNTLSFAPNTQTTQNFNLYCPVEAQTPNVKIGIQFSVDNYNTLYSLGPNEVVLDITGSNTSYSAPSSFNNDMYQLFGRSVHAKIVTYTGGTLNTPGNVVLPNIMPQKASIPIRFEHGVCCDVDENFYTFGSEGIYKIDTSGAQILLPYPWPIPVFQTIQSSYVTMDHDDNVYILTNTDFRLYKCRLDGTMLMNVDMTPFIPLHIRLQAGGSTMTYTTHSVVDSVGNIYLTVGGGNYWDTGTTPNYFVFQVIKVTPLGITSLIVNIPRPYRPNFTPTYNYASDLAVDSHDNIYICDPWQHNIKKLTPDGTLSTFVGLSEQPGLIDGINSNATLLNPHRMVIDSDDNIYVYNVDSSVGNICGPRYQSHYVRKITQTHTTTIHSFYTSDDSFPDEWWEARYYNGFFTKNNKIYYRTQHSIGVIDPITWDKTVLWTSWYTTNRTTHVGSVSLDPSGIGTFNNPVSSDYDVFGNLYVVDKNNHKIRKITPHGHTSTYLGTGVPGYVDGPRSIAQLNNPVHITVDWQGNVYVVEQNTPRIRKITPAGVISTFAGSLILGQQDGVGISATFTDITAICNSGTSTSHDIYVADNHKIRRISSDGVVTTIAGGSYVGAYVDDIDPNIATISKVVVMHRVHLDEHIIFVDDDNIRILEDNGGMRTWIGPRSDVHYTTVHPDHPGYLIDPCYYTVEHNHVVSFSNITGMSAYSVRNVVYISDDDGVWMFQPDEAWGGGGSTEQPFFCKKMPLLALNPNAVVTVGDTNEASEYYSTDNCARMKSHTWISTNKTYRTNHTVLAIIDTEANMIRITYHTNGSPANDPLRYVIGSPLVTLAGTGIAGDMDDPETVLVTDNGNALGNLGTSGYQLRKVLRNYYLTFDENSAPIQPHIKIQWSTILNNCELYWRSSLYASLSTLIGDGNAVWQPSLNGNYINTHVKLQDITANGLNLVVSGMSISGDLAWLGAQYFLEGAYLTGLNSTFNTITSGDVNTSTEAAIGGMNIQSGGNAYGEGGHFVIPTAPIAKYFQLRPEAQELNITFGLGVKVLAFFYLDIPVTITITKY